VENTTRKRVGGKEKMTNVVMPAFTLGAVAVVPIIIAIVQAMKMGFLPEKYAPLASIVVGILIGIVADHRMADLTGTILNGVMYGLSASGLYSGVKVTSDAVKQSKVIKEQKKNVPQETIVSAKDSDGCQ
jgi:hypothetical protein